MATPDGKIDPHGSTAAVAETISAEPVPRHRIILASLIGTTIEFYDFYIFATAAVSVFPLLFFAGGDASTALLASMATFGTAFIARPLGSIVFGHYGDRLGRKVTLVGALLTDWLHRMGDSQFDRR